jgi:AraC family transcriptional regulator of adaptative response/methylated-DNA-[protein]-cysteine methyltransferase
MLGGSPPDWVGKLMTMVEQAPDKRFKDSNLWSVGMDPTTVRRWFRQNLGMTFQGYQRAFRLGKAMGRLRKGDNPTRVAYDHGYESLSGFRDAFQKFFGVTPLNGDPVEIVTVTRIPTPLGPMIAGASERGICVLEFADRRMIETQIRRLRHRMKCTFIPGNHRFIDQLAGELERYFQGTLRRFSVPLDTPGSPFQQRTWKQLRSIPYGKTRSYQEQARMIGMPRAVRAVARANGDNRIAIVIPCHRVIGADGYLCGYGGGLWRKKRLLELEQNKTPARSY